jgi:hypothetical protein
MGRLLLGEQCDAIRGMVMTYVSYSNEGEL